jgi:hypothetical protein
VAETKLSKDDKIVITLIIIAAGVWIWNAVTFSQLGK